MITTNRLPAHIRFSQSIKAKLKYNLSNSCGQSLTYSELLNLASTNQQEQLQQLDLSYASLQGELLLRHEIAKFHQQLNQTCLSAMELNAEQVVTFAGAQEALKAVYSQLLEAGDEIIVVTPCYPSLTLMAETLGVVVKVLPLSIDQAWQIDLEQLQTLFSNKTKLVVINSPHNPTGSVLTTERINTIVQLAQRHNCYILADDVSQASNYSGLSLAHNVLTYEKGIVVSVLSKSFGLAGIRLGWLVCHDVNLTKRFLASKSLGSICTSKIDEQLAVIALQNAEQIIAKNNQLIADNIQSFQALVDAYPEQLAWHPPQAGILTLVEVKHSAKDMLTWCRQCAEQAGVLVLPSELFGLSGNYFRLGLGQKDFSQALNIFRHQCLV